MATTNKYKSDRPATPEAPYGYSDKGATLKADGTPQNFSGSYDDYVASREEGERREATGYIGGELTPGRSGDFDEFGNYTGASSGGGASSAMSDYQRQIEAAIAQNVNTLENQKNLISNDYDDIMADQYVLYRQNARDMPGTVGGMGQGDIASLNLQQQANYQNAVTDTMNQKANTLAGVDAQIADVEASGKLQIADAIAANAEQALLREQQLADEERAMQNQLELLREQNAINNQSEIDFLMQKSALENQYSTNTGASGGGSYTPSNNYYTGASSNTGANSATGATGASANPLLRYKVGGLNLLGFGGNLSGVGKENMSQMQAIAILQDAGITDPEVAEQYWMEYLNS